MSEAAAALVRESAGPIFSGEGAVSCSYEYAETLLHVATLRLLRDPGSDGERYFMLRFLIALSSVAAASCLQINPVAARSAAGSVTPSTQPLGRRAALSSAAAALAVAMPLSALADTQAMFDESQPGFDAAAEKRKAFQQKQKIFKKSWRKELSNLEFASNDAEAAEAIEALKKLIYSNGFEIPEGVRKMDLDQVYRTQKAKLNKETRLKFGELDSMVLKIVTVKPMGSD